jgi:hypothetical protein
LVKDSVLYHILILISRYKIAHLLAAFLIFVGIFIRVYPGFDVTSSQIWWILIVFSSTIPTSISGVYKEYLLKKEVTSLPNKYNSFERKLTYGILTPGTQIEIFSHLFRTSFFQLLAGIFWVLTVFIPLPLPAKNVQPVDFPNFLKDSILCFLGQNSKIGDNCEYTWAIYAIYVNFHIATSILGLV